MSCVDVYGPHQLSPGFSNYGVTWKAIILLEIGNALHLRESNTDLLQWPCVLDIITLGVGAIG